MTWMCDNKLTLNKEVAIRAITVIQNIYKTVNDPKNKPLRQNNFLKKITRLIKHH